MQAIDRYAEEHYNGYAVQKWLIDHCDYAIFISMVYLALVFKGADFFARLRGESGKPVDASARHKGPLLKYTWVLWNLSLSVFSFYGTTHVTPVLISKIKTHSLKYALCTLDREEFYLGKTGMALGLFCISKFPEMLDTLFILLSGKRNLPFLQWFHHITTFLFAWHAYAVGSSALYFAATLNYTVHTVMYFYFFLAELGYKRLVRPFAMYITLMQIAQMTSGLYFISTLVFYKIQDHVAGLEDGAPGTCAGTPWDAARVQWFIVAVNFVLFMHMFLSAYVFKRKPRAAAKKTEKAEAPEKKTA